MIFYKQIITRKHMMTDNKISSEYLLSIKEESSAKHPFVAIEFMLISVSVHLLSQIL